MMQRFVTSPTEQVLHLVLPGLLTRTAGWQADYGNLGRYPALEWLWSRGGPTPVRADDLETLLCRHYGADTDAPVAALTRLAAVANVPAGYWFCADPVHLTVGTDDLVLSRVVGPSLTAAESDALVTLINDHFQERSWRLHSAAPGYWHLCLEQDPGLSTVPLSRALGQRVGGLLPRESAAARAWQRDLTELQMLLFGAPVNAAREARGEVTVNSLWLWGGGRWPCPPPPAALATAHGHGALLEGLCRWTGTPLHPVPESATAWLASGPPQGHVLVVLEDLFPAAAGDDIEAWMNAMTVLEQNWFEPLRQALARGRLRHLMIQGEDGRGVRLDGGSRRRWWRRSRPFGECVVGLGAESAR
ncbi:hypothetical protein [Ectothiorhodospira lacustris]|uniref:hypothetical protein n=1 Tax=Ectothiorhodospira lacustris TaxID=2899127 RepID=UPI001EE8855F|nr:hypothetical protein [Ectothiorhodospira lacustris]MCG5500243.1 hypothetical protein [Ectothiorhodospira lacustris]MCG5510291.1 hypothetical protein [Ectothiorhodospira lacustris]MCG5521842.1 hypothetical protein [Ectothiorhodospira lacustris]